MGGCAKLWKGFYEGCIRLLFNSFVYHIWNLRNECIFKGAVADARRVCHQIWQDVQLKLLSHEYSMMLGDEREELQTVWGINMAPTASNYKPDTFISDFEGLSETKFPSHQTLCSMRLLFFQCSMVTLCSFS